MAGMDASASEFRALIALVAIGLRLGWEAHKRSASQRPIHGGAVSALFNYLSASCFAAILPAVLMIVIILRPENLVFVGIVWHPLILAALTLGLGSYLLALLHAFVERGPMDRAVDAEAARGWTEEDARSSGL